jgi:phage protein D
MTTTTTLSCCGRPMSTIGVTDEHAELSLRSCASCGRHTWSRAGVELDREQALAAVKARAEEVPRSKGGRPRKAAAAEPARRARPDGAQAEAGRAGAARTEAARSRAARAEADTERRALAERERRVREMQALLQGFTVHGE